MHYNALHAIALHSTYESMRPAVVGPNDPDAIPSGVLAGPA